MDMDGTPLPEKYHVKHDIRPQGPVETYEAVDDTGIDVAIKIVHTGDAAVRARFEEDLKSALDLAHPNVARPIGWGPYNTGYYVIREWVPGANLAALQRQGTISPLVAADYVAQACSALAALHERGVVHKDIRPENLVLGSGGTIKLIDVGIPRPGAAMAESMAPPYAAYYISPEQAEGEEPGPASDIYSLGVVLYQLCTGRVPFDGATAHEVATEHLHTQPLAPRQRNPQIPLPLEAVIVRAMAKNPARRYSSADEMREDLERVLALQPEVEAAPAPAGRIWPWVLAAVLALVLALGAAWLAITMPVPNVLGLSRAGAQQRLVGAGLKAGTVSYQQPIPTGARQGDVIGQSPSSGSRVRTGTAVNMVIAGPQLVLTPNLIGLSQADAIAALQGAKLVVGSVQQQFNAQVAAGRVMQQSPAAGRGVPVDSPIALVVSEGGQTTLVPNVVGLSQLGAITGLQGAGFKARVTSGFSEGMPAGGVITQAPAAGTEAGTGSTVNIVVSRGVGTVFVPDVAGMTRVAAANRLGRAGLRVRVITTSGGTVGRVTNEDPEAGTDVARGSTVTITVATGPE